MSLKLKDFITKLRACKTSEEEKQLILKEKAAIRQSFQKNQHQLKPRNLIKLLFINLQGYDTEFGQIESLNVTCRNSFVEKKVGYLTMQIFLHEKSEMLMMTTNRINLDLDHPNLYIKGQALSTFSSISDQDMAQQIHPKIKQLIDYQQRRQFSITNKKSGYQEDKHVIDNMKKKAILSAFRVICKQPQLYEEYLPLLPKVFDQSSHGLWISALPLFDRLYELGVQNPTHRQALNNLLPLFVKKIRKLVSHLDPDYSFHSVNDPFLIIGLLRSINGVLKKSQACGLGVDESINQDVVKLVFFIIGRFKPHKKAVNAVLYELARLTLFYKHNESLTSCGFHILNQLMETKESSPNFKFASLNLLKSFENISESSLKLLSNHCTLLLEIICKEDEDDSLRILALQVLSKITSHENLTNVVETLKQLLLKN